MLSAVDHTATFQPLPSASYVDECVVEENPWRTLFHSGTAGTTTDYFCVERLNSGAPYQFVKLSGKARALVALPQNDIEVLISLMKPSMSQLAAAFGVSRQRIYDWRNGAGMSPVNAEQLSALLAGARVLSEGCPGQLCQTANRKLGDGKTYWGAVASGSSPVDVAKNALRIIERDASERNALKRSLASRKFSRSEDPPLFSAHLSE